jgi:hypothetical protein
MRRDLPGDILGSLVTLAAYAVILAGAIILVAAFAFT